MATELEILKGSDCCHEFSEDILRAFLDKASKHDYKKGEILFLEETEGDEIFCLLQGWVDVGTKIANAEQAVEVALAEPGAFFGLEAFIQDGPRSVTATAKMDTTVLVWKTQELRGICEANPAIGYAFALNIAKVLHQRILLWSRKLLDSVSWGLE